LARQLALLAALLAVLVATSVSSLRSERSVRAAEASRMAFEARIEARERYFRARLSLLEARQRLPDEGTHSLTQRVAKLAAFTGAPDPFRRLAVLQRALGDSRWPQTLHRLRTQTTRAPFEVERELALWRRVLGEERVPPADVETLRAGIRAQRLGWYEHLALEALYENAGLNSEAERESARANRSFMLMILFGVFGTLVGMAGLVIGIALALFVRWRRNHPEASVPSWLEITPPPPLPAARAHALYTVFLAYLAAYAVISLAIARQLGALLRGLELVSPTMMALISLLFFAAWIAVPWIAYRRLARSAGLLPADLGLRFRGWSDVVWGVAGYSAALPVIFGVSILSHFLFRGVYTPLNPAVELFAGAPGLPLLLLLFFQAAVLAPLVEETMFRGVLFGALTARMGRPAAVVATSAVFALLHPQLPLGFLVIFALGAAFNVVYLLRGSIVPAIIAHAINNSMVLLLLILIVGD
jgi:membrane protease YdiL (CAAX protease family)